MKLLITILEGITDVLVGFLLAFVVLILLVGVAMTFCPLVPELVYNWFGILII